MAAVDVAGALGNLVTGAGIPGWVRNGEQMLTSCGGARVSVGPSLECWKGVLWGHRAVGRKGIVLGDCTRVG